MGGSNSSFVDRDILDHWQKLKLYRMKMIIDILSKRGVVDKKKFIAELCVECGFHRQTAIRYLEDLKDYGLIEITSNKIFWKDEGGD